MIQIRYFASIRETLNQESEQLTLPATVNTVDGLITHLVSLHGELWSKTLEQASVLVAVNQSMSKLSSTVEENDEVAFFPPVTGG